jgi:WD40 repeat protein
MNSSQTAQRHYFLSSFQASAGLVARAVSPEEIALVDWKEKKETLRLRTHTGQLKAIALHPNGQQLAACGSNGQLSLFDGKEGSEPKMLSLAGCTNILYSQDGEYLFAAAPGKLWILNSGDGSVHKELSGATNDHPALLACSPDGQYLAWSSFACHSLYLISLQGDGAYQSIEVNGLEEVFAMAFTLPSYGGSTSQTTAGACRLWLSLNTQRPQGPNWMQCWKVTPQGLDKVAEREMGLMNNSVALAVSPGGGSIVSGDGQGAQMWDIASGRPERRFAERETKKVAGIGSVEIPRSSLTSHIHFVEDGRTLITDGEYLRVWRVENGELLWTYTPA